MLLLRLYNREVTFLFGYVTVNGNVELRELRSNGAIRRYHCTANDDIIPIPNLKG